MKPIRIEPMRQRRLGGGPPLLPRLSQRLARLFARPASMVLDIESEDEFRRVLASDRPVLMVFHKTGCPTCVLLEPKIQRLARHYAGRVVVARYRHVHAYFKVTSWNLLREHRVYFVPTAILFVNGREVKRWTLRYKTRSYRHALDAALAGRWDQLKSQSADRGPQLPGCAIDGTCGIAPQDPSPR